MRRTSGGNAQWHCQISVGPVPKDDLTVGSVARLWRKARGVLRCNQKEAPTSFGESAAWRRGTTIRASTT
eukprot:4553437-Prymnesium_polylepis.1